MNATFFRRSHLPARPPGSSLLAQNDEMVARNGWSQADRSTEITHQREEVEAAIREQLEEERCSPGKFYPDYDRTWELCEWKTGKGSLSSSGSRRPR